MGGAVSGANLDEVRAQVAEWILDSFLGQLRDIAESKPTPEATGQEARLRDVIHNFVRLCEFMGWEYFQRVVLTESERNRTRALMNRVFTPVESQEPNKVLCQEFGIGVADLVAPVVERLVDPALASAVPDGMIVLIDPGDYGSGVIRAAVKSVLIIPFASDTALLAVAGELQVSGFGRE